MWYNNKLHNFSPSWKTCKTANYNSNYYNNTFSKNLDYFTATTLYPYRYCVKQRSSTKRYINCRKNRSVELIQ